MHIIKYILFIVFWISISAIFARYLMQFFSLFQNYFTSLLLEIYIPQAVSYCCIAIYSMYPPYIAFLPLYWLGFYMFHLTVIPNNYIIISSHILPGENIKIFLWDIYKNYCVICYSLNSIPTSFSYTFPLQNLEAIDYVFQNPMQ